MAFTELGNPYIGLSDADLQRHLQMDLTQNEDAILAQRPAPSGSGGHLGNQGKKLGHPLMSGRSAFPRRNQP
jgi:hypothetical protein